MIWISLVLLVVVLVYYLYRNKMVKDRESSKVKKADGKSPTEKFMEQASKYPKVLGLLDSIIKTLYKNNGASYGKNVQYGVMFLVSLVLFSIISIVVALIIAPMWYIGVVNAIIFLGIVFVIISTSFEYMEVDFNKKLPNATKLISSRYTMNNDIFESVRQTIEDVDPAVQKLLKQILEQFYKTNLSDVEAGFAEMEKMYDSKYVVYLITIIKKAYYAGGSETISEQLSVVIDDIYSDVTNQSAMTSTGLTYIVMLALLVPPFVWVLHYFGDEILTSFGKDFYSTPDAFLSKIGIYCGVMVTVLLIRFGSLKKPKL